MKPGAHRISVVVGITSSNIQFCDALIFNHLIDPEVLSMSWDNFSGGGILLTQPRSLDLCSKLPVGYVQTCLLLEFPVLLCCYLTVILLLKSTFCSLTLGFRFVFITCYIIEIYISTIYYFQSCDYSFCREKFEPVQTISFVHTN